MKKATFAIIVFVVAFVIPVGIYSLVLYMQGEDQAEESTEESSTSNHSPRVLSVPLTEAVVGQRYTYRIKASDEDGDELEYRMRVYPSWMEWDGSLMTLQGTPETADAGSHDVEIWISDGDKVVTQVFQVDVTVGSATSEGTTDGVEGEDQDVQGVSDQNVDENDGSDTEQDADLPAYGLSAGSSLAPIPRQQSNDADDTISDNDSPDTTEGIESAVLGAMTQLPDTAVFRGVLGLAFGVGVLAVALFLWADGTWNMSRRLTDSIEYESGRQIKMDMGSGVVVKKKKQVL